MTATFTAFDEQAVAQFTPVTGWNFAYNLNTDLVTTTTSGGTVTHSDNHAVLSTGAAINQTAKLETVRALRYIPGQGGKVRFTAKFSPGVAGSTQIIGLGDAVDGFFFGYNGADFGVMVRRAGVDTWTTRANWNNRIQSKMDTRLDPTKGNVYQILFQWLGYGAISFWTEEPLTGEFVLLHTVRYSNANTQTSIKNPTLPIMAYVANSTNSTDIVMSSPSAVAGLDGLLFGPDPIHPYSLYRTAAATKAGITTEAAVITLQNAATFQTITNRVRVRLTSLSVASDGTKNVILRLIKNTTLGGSPSYTSYNANTSPVSYDVAGTTTTGGTLIATLVLGKAESRTVDMAPFGVELAPGDKVTLSATSASSTEITAALTWADLF